MLYVRYGSGCSREQTACAARPSRCRSRQRVSSTPSSKVRRPPSTAFDKTRSIVADKGHPRGGQAEGGGVAVEPVQPGDLTRAEVVVNDVRQVAATVPGVEAEVFRLAGGDLPGPRQPVLLRRGERRFRRA